MIVIGLVLTAINLFADPNDAAGQIGTSRDLPPARARTAIARASASVVRVEARALNSEGIQTGVDVGTGFLVHPAGFVLTCHHVVHRAGSGLVQFKDGAVREFSVFARVPQYDIAFLKVDSGPSTSALDLRIPEGDFDGKPVLAIANLLGKGLATTRGSIAANGHTLTTDWVKTDGAMLVDLTLAAGASGAPILDPDGRVLGIAVSRPDDRLHLWDALNASLVIRACQEVVNLRCCKGLDTGTDLADSGHELVVAGLRQGAAAERGGVEIGDCISAVGDWPVRSAVDYHLSTLSWSMNSGDRPMQLTLVRGAEKRTIVANVQPERACTEALDDKVHTLKSGCRVTITARHQTDQDRKGADETFFSGWSRSLGLAVGLRDDQPYCATYQALVLLPAEGSYTFCLGCPGTGRLEVGESLIIEKKFEHPSMLVAGRQYFAKGLHRLTLSVNNKGIGEVPPVQVEGPSTRTMQPLPDCWLLDTSSPTR